jgi:hypothetical protein
VSKSPQMPRLEAVYCGREHGGVDQFVDDELVAMYFPLLSGPNHPATAVETAVALLRAVGHEDTRLGRRGRAGRDPRDGADAGRGDHGRAGRERRAELIRNEKTAACRLARRR